MAKNTVERMRAHLLPALFFLAIQSQSEAPTTPPRTRKPTLTASTVFSWPGVGGVADVVARTLWMRLRTAAISRITDRAWMAAPA